MTLPSSPFVCTGINLNRVAEMLFLASYPYGSWAEEIDFHDEWRDDAEKFIAAALGETIPVEVEQRCGGCGEPRQRHSRQTKGHYEPEQRFITTWQPVTGDSV